ncbi:MAG TPA: hypothetical protein ENK77_02465 [Epsilonproteobacteria bacterium]|nr:hypothetical protein [Campylobacterota bacterium]
MNKFFVPAITLSLVMVGCKGSFITDLPECSDPKYYIAEGQTASYQLSEVGKGEVRTEIYVTSAAGLGATSVEISSPEDDFFMPFLWKGCGGNEIYDVASLLLSGEGYVASFRTDDISQIKMHEVACADENVSINSTVYAAKRCEYASSDGVYSYESVVIDADTEDRPLGGVVFYTGYENGVENYSIKLMEWTKNY